MGRPAGTLLLQQLQDSSYRPGTFCQKRPPSLKQQVCGFRNHPGLTRLQAHGLGASDPERPAGLPAKPPPSSNAPSKASGFKPAFSFAPRAVAQTQRTQSPAQYVSPPVPSYNSPSPYQPASGPGSYSQPSYDAAPQIHNPFPAPGTAEAASFAAAANYDPEYEAQIAQWQSAYVSKDGEKPRLPGQSASAAAA